MHVPATEQRVLSEVAILISFGDAQDYAAETKAIQGDSTEEFVLRLSVRSRDKPPIEINLKKHTMNFPRSIPSTVVTFKQGCKRREREVRTINP
jgi:hypothetical protein